MFIFLPLLCFLAGEGQGLGRHCSSGLERLNWNSLLNASRGGCWRSATFKLVLSWADILQDSNKTIILKTGRAVLLISVCLPPSRGLHREGKKESSGICGPLTGPSAKLSVHLTLWAHFTSFTAMFLSFEYHKAPGCLLAFKGPHTTQPKGSNIPSFSFLFFF